MRERTQDFLMRGGQSFLRCALVRAARRREFFKEKIINKTLDFGGKNLDLGVKLARKFAQMSQTP